MTIKSQREGKDRRSSSLILIEMEAYGLKGCCLMRHRLSQMALQWLLVRWHQVSLPIKELEGIIHLTRILQTAEVVEEESLLDQEA